MGLIENLCLEMPGTKQTYPKISIVTPSYNQGKYIEQTITSVLNQNYPNLEYIIIDGGSTDDTVEIIKKYEHQLAYWVSEQDKGQTDAINKGFEKCTGVIFNWINSDDYYEPGTFEKLVKLFTDFPHVNVICGKEWSFNDETPEKKTPNAGSIIKENVYETIRVGIIDQPCTFFRKEAIDAFFPLNSSLKYVMDKQLWWKYLLKYGQNNILQISKEFTNFRLHNQSKTVSDADLFDLEFDRLRRSLFLQLKAPDILNKQLHQNLIPLNSTWQINIKYPDFILAEFAAYFAERNYVLKNLKDASELLKFVKSVKNNGLSKKERKLWFLLEVIPRGLLIFLKNIKSRITISS